MEEDPESEWEIKEYSSSSNKGETSMMKWILNKGYGIGKKMMITGIAISAAPLVLPPILVFSAMGVAFSVPSGLVFATYACTNKLMRMLLPTPPSPVLLLEYYSDGDQHVKEEAGADVGDDCGKYVGDSITNLDENEEEKVHVAGNEEEGGGLIMNVDEIVVEKSYYTNENVDEKENKDVEKMEDRLGLDVASITITNSDEDIVQKGFYDDDDDDDDDDKEEVQPYDNKQEKQALVVNEKTYDTNENDDKKEMEDLKQGVETRLGLVVGSIKSSDEHIVGEGSHDINADKQAQTDDVIEGFENEMEDHFTKEDETEQMEDIKQEVDTRLGLDVGSGVGDENENNNIREDEKEEVVEESNGASNVASGVETIEPVMVKEIECEKLIHNDNERVGEIRHVVILARGDEGNNFNSREVEELDLVARKVVGVSEKHGRNFESDEKVMRESMGTQEKNVSDTMYKDGTERTNEANLISLNADARDQVGDESATVNSVDLEAGGEDGTDNRLVAAENGTKLPTKESLQDVFDEEKIWEKIGAMRGIVGYKVPRQQTCIEELKALYVFTGVEPPVSFNGNSGLDEVNEKLKFLMSIVGVK